MAGEFAPDSYGGMPGTISDRDRAVAIGTMMGEAWHEGLKGMAAVGDVIANRMADPAFSAQYGSTIAGQAHRASEFSTWSKDQRSAYETATKAAFAPDKLSPAEKVAYQDALKAFDGVFVNGSLRGVSQGATFYSNTAVTAKLGTGGFHGKMADKYGSVQIGNHTFTGPNIGKPEAYVQPYSATGYMQNTPAEVNAVNRAQAAFRDTFRGPSDFGAPVWDGTYSAEPTLAAPVGAVSFGGALPDARPADTPLGSLASAYDTASAPGPDLGANLASAVPSSDWTNSVSPYGFSSMSYSPGMSQVQDQLSQSYAGMVPGGGAFAASPAANVTDTGFSAINAGSLGTAPGFGAGIVPDAPVASAPVGSYGFSKADVGSMAGPATLGMDVTPNAMPSLGPTSFSATNMIDPGMNGAFGLTGVVGSPLGTTATNMLGLDGVTAKPNTAAATATPDLPGFVLPPEVVPPTTTQAVRASMTPAPAAPAIEAPRAIRSVNAPASAPNTSAATTTQAAPSPMSPEAWLGSVMQGGSPAVGGMSNYGLGQLAREGGLMAQPAMLGLENAYAAANGLQGPRGLFDGLFSGSMNMPDMSGIFSGQNIGRVGGGVVGGMVGGVPGALLGGLLGNVVGGWMSGSNGGGGISDGLGAVRDAATGQTLGAFDPSDPAHNGYPGWGDSWGGGLGNTPGAGGLY